jgi:hypothetical protein
MPARTKVRYVKAGKRATMRLLAKVAEKPNATKGILGTDEKLMADAEFVVMTEKLRREGIVTSDENPCVFCGADYGRWGNNPAPVVSEGRCCDECNAVIVIPARLGAMRG